MKVYFQSDIDKDGNIKGKSNMRLYFYSGIDEYGYVRCGTEAGETQDEAVKKIFKQHDEYRYIVVRPMPWLEPEIEQGEWTGRGRYSEWY